MMKKKIAVLLHNVRSAHNVGSIFRTADAAGVFKLFLSGYTPTPKDRFGRAQKEIAKTALGAEKFLTWKYSRSPISLITSLKSDGWTIIGVEQNARAHDYQKVKTIPKTVFIFGNEVKGIPKAILKQCDSIIEIPMHGKKESLNVSVAAGVILFSVR